MTKVGGYKALLLAGVSAAVLAGGLAGAQAQVAIYAPGATPPRPMILAVPTVDPVDPGNVNTAVYQNNTAASINAGATGNSVNMTAPSDGVNTYSVTSNAITSNGTGNLFTGAISAGVLGTTQGGIAAALLQTNSGPLVVTSAVANNTTSATLSTFTIGSASVTGNRDQAETDLNKSLNTIEGQVPNGYASATPGAIVYSPAFGTVLTTQGSVALGNNQVNSSAGQSAGSAAVAANNGISLSINASDTTAQTVVASPTVTGNTISALFQGNVTDNSVLLHTGANPTYTGSIALSNNQFNLDGTINANTAASNLGSSITATVGNTGSAALQSLAGPLSVSNNTISSAATGNDALTNGSGGTTGNVISLDPGLNYAAPATQPIVPTVNFAAVGAFGPTPVAPASVDTGLALMNVQTNVAAPLTSVTVSPVISATVQDMSLGGGTVAVGSNLLSANSTGSLAYNSISNGAVAGATTPTAASFDGTAGITNLQTNAASPMTAMLTGTPTVGAAVATTTGSLTDGAVSVDANTFHALAFGNEATNSIALQAVDLATVGNGVVPGPLNLGDRTVLVAGVIPPGSAAGDFATGGSTITNLQVIDGNSPVTAIVDGVQASISAGNARGGPISVSAVDLNNNTVEALVTANNVTSSLSLLATTLSGSAGVTSTQVDAAAATANLGSAADVITTTGGITNSSIAADSNTMRAAANGNNATNSLTANVTTLNSLGRGGVIVGADLGGTGIGGIAQTGVLSVQNMQFISGDVTATVGTTGPGPTALVELNAAGNAVSGSVLSVTGNQSTAAAVGNIATNSLSLSLDTATAGTNSNGPSVNIGSLQESIGTPVVTAVSTGVGAGILAGSLQNSTVTVANNSNTAGAIVNDVNNTLTVSAATTLGTSVTSVAKPLGFPAAAGATIGVFGAPVVLSGITGDAVVDSVQSATGTATATAVSGTGDTGDGGYGLTVSGSMGSSTLSVTGNTTTAQATANVGNNALTLDATTLSATGAILNVQTSTATVDATAVGQIGSLVGGTTTASTVTVTGNSVSATATGNAVSNTLNGTAGASYGGATQTVGGTGVGVGGVADGAVGGYVILNDQSNSGPVTALAGAPGGQSNIGPGMNGTVTNSSVTMTGNSVASTATGNSAFNQVTLNSLPNGSPSVVVGNNQVNTGPITAMTSGANISTPASASVGSGYNLTGNSVTASATGNSATNIVTVGSGPGFSRH